MDTQKATAEYRLSQRAQVIKAHQESGQNIQDFCQTNRISRNAYFYWQRKLRKTACTELAKAEETISMIPSGWMQLTSKHANDTKDTLDIEINGCHIAVNVQTDPELLKRVCHILRSLV